MFQFASTEPQFEVGQLVCHRRYGYRGVIVAVDSRCQADQQWYMRNQTQPNLNQPWYHVLVDAQATSTYAAESSLLADESGEEVDHPLVEMFFEGFEAGRYRRNERPWKGW